jgi:DNA-binding XRE family transcriptional regulator
MNTHEKNRLKEKGWRVGSTQDFLELTDAELAYIDLRLALARALREQRRQSQSTQTQVARMIHSNQSRVAKMESGDASVSLDLLIRSLLTLGITRDDLAQTIADQKTARPFSAP